MAVKVAVPFPVAVQFKPLQLMTLGLLEVIFTVGHFWAVTAFHDSDPAKAMPPDSPTIKSKLLPKVGSSMALLELSLV